MTPSAVAEALSDASVALTVVDVRENWERDIAAVAGSLNIPLGELPARLAELPENETLALLCHSGVRSTHAMQFLNANGFTDVYNITGGIDRWSVDVDSQIARY
ncbi:MAG: rhodanese-like domain-containing protein [Pseudomonadota bacterium]